MGTRARSSHVAWQARPHRHPALAAVEAAEEPSFPEAGIEPRRVVGKAQHRRSAARKAVRHVGPARPAVAALEEAALWGGAAGEEDLQHAGVNREGAYVAVRVGDDAGPARPTVRGLQEHLRRLLPAQAPLDPLAGGVEGGRVHRIGKNAGETGPGVVEKPPLEDGHRQGAPVEAAVGALEEPFADSGENP